MERGDCGGGTGCSNWYVWESETDRDKDGESGVTRGRETAREGGVGRERERDEAGARGEEEK